MLAEIRKIPSAILASGAIFSIIQALLWLLNIRPVKQEYICFYFPHIVEMDMGPLANLIGGMFILIAATLSLEHKNTTSKNK